MSKLTPWWAEETGADTRSGAEFSLRVSLEESLEDLRDGAGDWREWEAVAADAFYDDPEAGARYRAVTRAALAGDDHPDADEVFEGIETQVINANLEQLALYLGILSA